MAKHEYHKLPTKQLAAVIENLTIRQLVDVNIELEKSNIRMSFSCGKLPPLESLHKAASNLPTKG